MPWISFCQLFFEEFFNELTSVTKAFYVAHFSILCYFGTGGDCMILLDVAAGYMYGMFAMMFVLPIAVLVILLVLLTRFFKGRKK